MTALFLDEAAARASLSRLARLRFRRAYGVQLGQDAGYWSIAGVFPGSFIFRWGFGAGVLRCGDCLRRRRLGVDVALFVEWLVGPVGEGVAIDVFGEGPGALLLDFGRLVGRFGGEFFAVRGDNDLEYRLAGVGRGPVVIRRGVRCGV
jgi:hypothetical protein